TPNPMIRRVYRSMTTRTQWVRKVAEIVVETAQAEPGRSSPNSPDADSQAKSGQGSANPASGTSAKAANSMPGLRKRNRAWENALRSVRHRRSNGTPEGSRTRGTHRGPYSRSTPQAREHATPAPAG